MRIDIETITPERARQMLLRNTGNRKVREDRVALYANEMRRGLWQLTGDPITFDTEGRLVQGQHRLLACIEADVPFDTAVARNAAPEVFSVVDTPLVRSMGDVLDHDGVSNARTVASAVKMILAWRQEIANDRRGMVTTILRDDIAEFTRKHHDELQRAISISRPLVKVGGTMSAWVPFVFEASVGREDEMAMFAEGVATGAALPQGDFRLALRNWLVNRGANRIKTEPVEYLMTIVRAWKGWLDGRSVQSMRPWRRGLPLEYLEDE